MRKKICVIDGQGGGIGSTIIGRLKMVYGETVEILALGTNAIATSRMLKAKANRGATGENAIAHTLRSADVIVGPLGIVLAHAMMGEVTPKIASAVAGSAAPKFLLPLSQENVAIVGVTDNPLPHLVEELVDVRLKDFLNGL
jgi:hypothetical protein